MKHWKNYFKELNGKRISENLSEKETQKDKY